MLIYHPAMDVHHTVYRLLSIMRARQFRPTEVEALSLADGLLVFPSVLAESRFPVASGGRKAKKMSRERVNVYLGGSTNRLDYYRLRQVQHSAFIRLTTTEIVRSQRFREGVVEIDEAAVPSELHAYLSTSRYAGDHIVSFLATVFMEVGVSGPNGMKARTRLMEHRFDRV
jgi:hypothetical protein